LGGEGAWRIFFIFHFFHFPNMFLQVLNGSPSTAQWVPNVFPKGVPNSTLL
jgi:hypothetical protein